MAKVKIEEIRELKEMGFSNQEILQLSSNGEVTTTEQKPVEQNPVESKQDEAKPDEVKPEEQKPVEEQKPAENPEVSELKKTVSGMQEDLKKFISSMQKNNLQSASFQMADDKTLEDKAVDSLSEIIRPKFNEGGKSK